MGTSTSSSGAPSGVPFDPPWLRTVASMVEPSVEAIARPNRISGPGRFRGARLQLSKYLSAGSSDALHASFARYVRKGLGGAAQATSRMRVPIAVSSAMVASLLDLSECVRADDYEDWMDQVLSAPEPFDELSSSLAKQILPEGGSVDEESCRKSLAFSIAEFQRENPDFDVSEFDLDSIWDVVLLFLESEVYNRFILDIGQRLEQIEIGSMVQKEVAIKNYIKATLKVSISRMRGRTIPRTRSEIAALIGRTLNDTFEIFEGGEE